MSAHTRGFTPGPWFAEQQFGTDPILELQAARLFPLDAYLRREWMRAVSVVRSTTNGWVLDRKVPRATP